MITRNDFVGLTEDEAINRIETIPDLEIQAALLIELDNLVYTPRGLKLADKIAGPESPARAQLLQFKTTREEKKKADKAKRAARKVAPKPIHLVRGSLFDM